jgi:hypothetical protein
MCGKTRAKLRTPADELSSSHDDLQRNSLLNLTQGKESSVRKFPYFAAGAVVAAAAAIIASSAFAAGTAKVAFRANFSGKAVVRVSGSHAEIVSAQAAGRGVPIGKATLFGKGAGNSSDPCPLFGGPATITTTKGKLKFAISPIAGSACTDEQAQQFSLSGRALFKGGTRKYAKAKGSFKFAGTYNRSTGAFAVKFVGTLTL